MPKKPQDEMLVRSSQSLQPTEGLFGNGAEKHSKPSPFSEWFKADLNAPLPKNLDFEEWQQWGGNLVTFDTTSRWKLAFWLAFGEHKWPDWYGTIAEGLGLDKKTLYNYASIARAFASIPPAGTLTIGHHEPLANKAFSDEERQELLTKAEAENLTRDELRVLAKEKLDAKHLPKPKQPDWTNGGFGKAPDIVTHPPESPQSSEVATPEPPPLRVVSEATTPETVTEGQIPTMTVVTEPINDRENFLRVDTALEQMIEENRKLVEEIESLHKALNVHEQRGLPGDNCVSLSNEAMQTLHKLVEKRIQKGDKDCTPSSYLARIIEYHWKELNRERKH